MSSIVVEPQAIPRAPVFRGPARWGVAGLLLGGALFQLLGTLLEPEQPDPAARVAYWSAHQTRIGVGMALGRNHVSNIFAKLQVADRAQAIVRAREAGLGR
jgi:hypothetical protein